MSGLLSEKSDHNVKMYRLQFLFISLFAAGIYFLLVIAKGKYLQIPDYFYGFTGLSSMGYLTGKGFINNKEKRSKN